MSDETIEPASDVASSHTTGRMSGRIEIVGRVSGRRRWTVEQKLAILRDAFGPDGSVRTAVERHEVGKRARHARRMADRQIPLLWDATDLAGPLPETGRVRRR